MSEPVSALNGAAATDGIAQVTEMGVQGMITLRGDLTSAPLKKAVKAVGCKIPATRRVEPSGAMAAAWMSPDEVLILCPYDNVEDTMAKLTAALGTAHALAVNVSDARAMFRVTGPHTRDVIAKLAPVDMSPSAFGVGDFRRTRFAQAAAAFHMPDDTTCEIVCFRSVAQYMFDLLSTVATSGSEVGFHAPR